MPNPVTDIGAAVKAIKGINPEDSAAQTINGPAVDRHTYNLPRSAVVACQVGAETGSPTSKTVNYKLQDSPDNSTWADYGSAGTTITADDTDGELDLDLNGADRYVRVVVTVAFVGGTSPTVPVGATLVLGGADTLAI